jgi:hypothetical protein
VSYYLLLRSSEFSTEKKKTVENLEKIKTTAAEEKDERRPRNNGCYCYGERSGKETEPV